MAQTSHAYVVSKNVPIPPVKAFGNGRTKGQSKYAWMNQLDVGDHLVVDTYKEANLLDCAMRRLTDNKRTFSQRLLDNGKIGLWVNEKEGKSK